jgi:hypothetical protein
VLLLLLLLLLLLFCLVRAFFFRYVMGLGSGLSGRM